MNNRDYASLLRILAMALGLNVCALFSIFAIAFAITQNELNIIKFIIFAVGVAFLGLLIASLVLAKILPFQNQSGGK